MSGKDITRQPTIEQIEQAQWEATMGKNFPLSSHGFEMLVAIAVAVFFAWCVYSLWRAFKDDAQEQKEAEEAKRVEEEQERALKLERLRLKRQRLKNRNQCKPERSKP